MADWSRQEVRHTVSAYLHMLMLELSGQTLNKAAINRDLIDRLDARSKQAIEFKHCNVSAALAELGFPFVLGYKPRSNFQRILVDELVEQLGYKPALEQAALQAVELPAVAPRHSDFASVLAKPPPVSMAKSEAGDHDMPRVAKRDYLAIEARNRSLGLAGEHFILAYERWRLKEQGRSKLAGKVEHTSEQVGDGAGYDILSFETNGRPRYIEVKTTAYTPATPFWISDNELRFSERKDLEYHLARVYEFRRSPHFFMLDGPPSRHCELDPVSFRARLR